MAKRKLKLGTDDQSPTDPHFDVFRANPYVFIDRHISAEICTELPYTRSVIAQLIRGYSGNPSRGDLEKYISDTISCKIRPFCSQVPIHTLALLAFDDPSAPAIQHTMGVYDLRELRSGMWEAYSRNIRDHIKVFLALAAGTMQCNVGDFLDAKDCTNIQNFLRSTYAVMLKAFPASKYSMCSNFTDSFTFESCSYDLISFLTMVGALDYLIYLYFRDQSDPIDFVKHMNSFDSYVLGLRSLVIGANKVRVNPRFKDPVRSFVLMLRDVKPDQKHITVPLQRDCGELDQALESASRALAHGMRNSNFGAREDTLIANLMSMSRVVGAAQAAGRYSENDAILDSIITSNTTS